MNKEPSTIKKTYGDFSPKLVHITDDVLIGDIWERPKLSKRDRSLVTVPSLALAAGTGGGGCIRTIPPRLFLTRGWQMVKILKPIRGSAPYSSPGL